MREYFAKNYAKKHKVIFLIFAFLTFSALLLEVFIADTFELADAMALLSLSVMFFIESKYPHLYEPQEKSAPIPLDKQLLLFLCNFVFTISLIAKFML